jgi:hypothetical protein
MVALQQRAFVGNEIQKIRIDASSLAAGIYQLTIAGKETVIERESYRTIIIQR